MTESKRPVFKITYKKKGEKTRQEVAIAWPGDYGISLQPHGTSGPNGDFMPLINAAEAFEGALAGEGFLDILPVGPRGTTLQVVPPTDDF